MEGVALAPKLNRRSIQEFRIDYLLEEEFSCDPDFALRFAKEAGLECDRVDFKSVELEPSLGGSGYGDLLVVLEAHHASDAPERIALLIEDKISASAQPRQAERYLAFGKNGLGVKWDRYRTVLVAPDAYVGERQKYDAFISLERICDWICASDPRRAGFQQDKIREAITKQSLTGLQNEDLAVTAFRKAYYEFVVNHNAVRGTDFECTPPRRAYEGDTWIIIRSSSLPRNSQFRHRLSTTMKNAIGIVEVAFRDTDRSKADDLAALIDKDMRLIANGKYKQHVAIELDVPEIRAPISFDAEQEKVAKSLAAIERLWQLCRTYDSQIAGILASARNNGKNGV